MRILTLNINSIRAHIESFIDILKSGEYDTVLVQELKCDDTCFPHNVFDEYGYNVKVFGQKSWNGVAVFSKYSIEDVVRGLPNFPQTDARFMECVVDGKYRIINVYMPNGESIDSPKFPYKIDWMQHFGDHIKHLLHSEEMVIIGGDFNVAITDADIWDPKAYEGSSISAPTARSEMAEWLGSGWTDCFRKIHPEKTGYTWYGYRGGGGAGPAGSVEKNHGLRLDYFLANHAAAKHIQDCDVDIKPRLADRPTDHAGLALTIK